MKLIQYILFVLLLFNSSCRKDKYIEKENKPCQGIHDTIFYISSDLLDYRFKTGSYWIFVDSTNSIIDSFCVTFFRLDYNWYPCNISLESHLFCATSYPSLKSGCYEISYNSLTKGGITINYTLDHNGSNPGDFTTIHYDSLLIHNQYYHQVAKTTVTYDITEGYNYTSIYYMNPEFGFLKIDVYDSTSILVSQKLLDHCVIVR